jgi:hypothetical protein
MKSQNKMDSFTIAVIAINEKPNNTRSKTISDDEYSVTDPRGISLLLRFQLKFDLVLNVDKGGRG